MKLDDETTATQLHKMLSDKGIDISLKTILRYVQLLQHIWKLKTCIALLLFRMCITMICICTCRCRTSLGWTFRGSAYCQMIREANKINKLQWAQQYQDDSFDDVIWTDESTIQLENHRRFCYQKVEYAPKPKPK